MRGTPHRVQVEDGVDTIISNYVGTCSKLHQIGLRGAPVPLLLSSCSTNTVFLSYRKTVRPIFMPTHVPHMLGIKHRFFSSCAHLAQENPEVRFALKVYTFATHTHTRGSKLSVIQMRLQANPKRFAHNTLYCISPRSWTRS